MKDHVLSGLAKRRAEIVAEIKKADLALQSLMADLEHLDATVKQFDPASRPAPAIRTYRGQRGHMTKAILTMLRRSGYPMTVRAIAVQIMADRDMDRTDKKAVLRMIVQVRIALLRQQRNGVVAYQEKPEESGVWGVAVGE